MDIKQIYREETNLEPYFDAGLDCITCFSPEYVKWLEAKINYTRCCATLKDLKGNEIQIKSLSDLKKMYPKGTTFSVAGNGRELNYYVDGKVAYTRSL